jgi:metal-sulfur cluster biosynthetic enzyme
VRCSARERGIVDPDSRQAVEPCPLDQHPDLGPRAAELHHAAASADATGQHREVEHQRCIREHQPAQIDDHIRLRADRSDQRGTATALGAPILVAADAEYGRLVIELDDSPAKLLKPARTSQGLQSLSRKLLTEMASVDDVTEALRDVIDPELGLDFVELGLIYDVQVEDGTVNVIYTLTSPGCPIGPQVSEQIEEFVGELEGVQDVRPTMTFSPPWTPDRMSEDAKFALGF